MKSIVWLDKPHQALGLSSPRGAEGRGEGNVAGEGLVRRMTRGLYGEPRSVLIVSSEDSASIDLKLRLVAVSHGQVCSCSILFVLPVDLGSTPRPRARCRQCRFHHHRPRRQPPRRSQHGSGRRNPNSAIGGLNQLADDIDCAILGVRHFGKSRQNGALQRRWRL